MSLQLPTYSRVKMNMFGVGRIMADSNGPQKDWYSILSANPSDDIQEIKQKYQKLILVFHPDKQRPGLSGGEAEHLLQKFIDVDQAWKILSDERSRKEYDLQLRACELKQSWPVDAHVTLDEMNWNADTECYTYSCRCGGEFILDQEDIQEAETVVCCDSCSLSIEVQKVT
ncbi:Zinc finger-containing protein 3 [Triplophysa tibetana]|uniref:Zinc finger-containing protein 3 n=1 Tax=Triplophysa tibetana TaxID=1572043 RepID=A0A5A9PRZ4_9TELE|nr:Zinc finger-containing protein 3 [Triplophysa tibetana]